MTKDLEIKEYWDEQARQHGTSYLATIPDHYARELEINTIEKFLSPGNYVADIGCGNGYSSIRYAQARSITILGLDFSVDMIDMANKALIQLPEELKKRVSFRVGDVRQTGLTSELFDTVITDRCLINLPTNDEQSTAIREIHRLLKEGGIYLMCECSAQGLRNLNELRNYMGLETIKTRWHNLYLDESHLKKVIKGLFKIEEIVNFSSFYYLASRIINAKIAQEHGTEPDYDSDINRVAAMCSSLSCFGDFGPVKLFVLRKVRSNC